MCFSIFSKILSKGFLLLGKNSAKYCYKRTQTFMSSARYSCQILIKLEFSRQIFEEKNSEISWKSVNWGKILKSHENPSSGKNTEISWKSVKWEKYWNFKKIRQVGKYYWNFMKIRQVGKILKFHENPSSGKNTEISWKSVKWETSSFNADGQTDRHDETNNRFSQFCERA